MAVTPHFSLILPTVGGSVNEWGGNLNTDLGLIDTALYNNQTVANWAKDTIQGALEPDYDWELDGDLITRLDATEDVADDALPKAGGTMSGLVEVFTAQCLRENLSGEGAQVLNYDAANVFVITAAANIQITISGTTPSTGQTLALLLRMQLGAIYTVSWAGVAIEWAYGEEPTWSEDGYDWISLLSLDGTNWSGALAQADVK